MMYWFFKVLTQDAAFNGRSRRKEICIFLLINAVITVGVSLLDVVLGGEGQLLLLYSVVMAIPLISVSVRRLHDIGWSGYWSSLGFVPLIGLIGLLFILFKAGEEQDNKYGPNPKLEQ